MTTIDIETLEGILVDARKKECRKVRLQLYDNWEDIERQQRKPDYPDDNYKVDLRYYNTVEFETKIKDMLATDQPTTKIEGDTLIIRVSLSDRDSLLKNLGIEDAYNN